MSPLTLRGSEGERERERAPTGDSAQLTRCGVTASNQIDTKHVGKTKKTEKPKEASPKA